MTNGIQEARPTTGPPLEGSTLDPATVSVRVKLAALWTSTLFVYGYVDLFSLYRPDVRASLDAGEIAGLTVDQPLLLATTLYIVVPSLMIYASVALRPGPARALNVVLAGIYTVTVAAAAVGEWAYFLLGSAVEVLLAAAIVYHAWTWPRRTAA